MNLELYESTWVAMSVGLSIIIGFVAFVAMMNDKDVKAEIEKKRAAAQKRGSDDGEDEQ